MGLLCLFAPVDVQEIEVLVPVVGGDVVFAGSDVVGDVVGGGGVYGVVGWGQGGGGEALMAQEAVDPADVYCGQELRVGIGPEVVLGAGDVEWTGGDEGEEEVAVDGDLCLSTYPLGVVGTEPVREGALEVADVLAEAATVDGLSCFAGFGREDDGEAWVLCGGPVCGFAEAGVSGDGDTLGVDLFIGLQVIEGSAESPGPGTHGSPVVGGRGGLVGGVEEGADA